MVLDKSASWGGSQFWTGDLLHLLQLFGVHDVQVELAWSQQTHNVFMTNYLKWVVPFFSNPPGWPAELGGLEQEPNVANLKDSILVRPPLVARSAKFWVPRMTSPGKNYLHRRYPIMYGFSCFKRPALGKSQTKITIIFCKFFWVDIAYKK